MGDANDSPVGGAPETEEREPKGRTKGVRCEFCDCELFADGSVKKKSDTARKFEKSSGRWEETETEISELRARVSQLAQENKDLKDSSPSSVVEPPKEKKGFHYIL